MGIFDSLDKIFETIENVGDEVAKEIRRNKTGSGKYLNSALDTVERAALKTSRNFDKGMENVNKYIDSHKKEINEFGNAVDYALESAEKAIDKVATFVVNVAKQLVDLLFIREQVQQVNPNAFRALILEKKKNAVDVGIFSNGKMSERITINSDLGVTNDIYKGQIIDIYS